MITVKEAEKIVLKHCRPLPAVVVNLSQAYGAVLRENIIADRDQPPADRSTVDGIVIAFSSWQNGVRCFNLQGIQKAGIPALTLKEKTSCLEIATGSVLPKNGDCVIPIEQVKIINKLAVIDEMYRPQRLQFLHSRGADYKKGQILLRAGSVLNPQQIALAAAVGKSKIKITRQPKIAVIGTGDELLAINKTPKIFQARRSNAVALESLLSLNGFSDVKCFHINDNAQTLHKVLQRIIRQFDVLVLSGGVSMGKFDLVPAALKKLGVQVLFHKVSQKPGKPFWFGKTGTGVAVFALPGNPVSTQICAYRYVLPYLKKTMGVNVTPQEFAKLTTDFNPNTKFIYFLPVKLKVTPKAELSATPAPFAMSGNYASLVQSDGFIQLNPEDRPFRKGNIFSIFRWRLNY